MAIRAVLLLAVVLLAASSFAPASAGSSLNRRLQAAKSTTFALIGDWGGVGGQGDPGRSKLPIPWTPGAMSCPPTAATPFYEGTPFTDPTGHNYTVAPCVKDLCGQYASGSDSLENCQRTIQQLVGANLFNNVCKARNCDLVINAGDNFYVDGCNATAGPWGETCQGRFKDGWSGVYQNSNQPYLKNLVWQGCLGNHDVLGNIEGVEEQIAYSQQDKTWTLPARWYNTTIGSGSSAINLVVLHSSCFIDSYLKPTNKYSTSTEEQTCSTPEMRQVQLDFLQSAMADAAQKPGWFVLMSHHPPISGGDTSYISDGTSPPESTAWAQVQQLIQTYKPVAVISGHDHVLTYSSLPIYETQFLVAGAGSGTSSADGGWNATCNCVRSDKPYLKYGSVSMNGGATWTGFMVLEAVDTTFQADMYVANTGDQTQFTMTCTKKMGGGYNCSGMPGKSPNYVNTTA